jgi:hypothetical protein
MNYKVSASTWHLVAVLAALAALAMYALPYATAQAQDVLCDGDCVEPQPEWVSDPDVTICHATRSDTNPYTHLTVNAKSIINLPNGHHFHGPDDVVWYDGIEDEWGDIIPPFTYDAGEGEEQYPGKNLPAGQTILDEDCSVGEPEPKPEPKPEYEEIEICKYDGEQHEYLPSWTIVVSNSESDEYTTEGDGCVTVEVDPEDGPWHVTEIMPDGEDWELVDVNVHGGTPYVNGELLGCTFFGEPQGPVCREVAEQAEPKDDGLCCGDCHPPREYRCKLINVQQDEPPVDNTCLIPTALGDEEPFTLGEAPVDEDDLETILGNNGFSSIDVLNDQMNYQLWETEDPDTDFVTFTVTVLGKEAGNMQAFGYFEAGDASSFVPMFEVGDHSGFTADLVTVGQSKTVTIPASVAASFGFAMYSEGVGGEWHSEYSLSTDGEDNFAVYNPEENVYVLAIEDQSEVQGSDNDHNDLVVLVDNIICEEDGNKTEIELCKRDVTGAPISGWGMTLANDEVTINETTEGDGCVMIDVHEEQGPWFATEAMSEGWALNDVMVEGGDLHYGDQQELLGCVFFGNNKVEDDLLSASEATFTDCVECGEPTYRCTFVNEQEVPDDPEEEEERRGGGSITYGSRGSSDREDPVDDTTTTVNLEEGEIGGVADTRVPVGGVGGGAGGASGGSTGMIPVALALGFIGILATRRAIGNEI